MATTITKTKTGLNWGSNGIEDGNNDSGGDSILELTANSFKIKLGIGTPGRRYFTINKETVLGNNATLIKVVANFSGYTTQNRDHGVYIWGHKTAYAESTADDSTKFTTTLQSGYSLETTDLYLTDSGNYTVYLGAGGKTIFANTAYFSNVSFDLTYTVPGYTLAVTAGTGGSVSATDSEGNVFAGSKDIEAGTAVILRAIANEEDNYKFLMWDDGDTNITRTVTVSADKTYTAIFEKLGADNTYTDGEKCSEVWMDGEKCSQLWIDGVKVFG